MNFCSIQFLIFFPAIVILYWVLPDRWRNAALLIASYYFYMNWSPQFGLLLAAASAVTWGGGLLISKFAARPKLSKRIFIASLALILAMLFTFKYLTFLAGGVFSLLSLLGLRMHVPDFRIVLPVGISFFTFQALGYLVDVRRGQVPAERSLMTVALFLAFFPQLVAGPIERAKSLLPQFKARHYFSIENVIAGVEMMLLGYFMKLCVADKVAPFVDAVFSNPGFFNRNYLIFAAVFFSFQIFSDFCGYSLIAIGAARCMGFRLMQNFRQPYLATSMREFWRRWHSSLSRWLTDYVYIPLGGNRVSPRRHYFNIFTTMLASGVWHGANLTFFCWGAYHGILQAAQAAWHRKSKFHLPENFLTKVCKIIWVFILVTLGRIFFRAESVADAMTVFHNIFTGPAGPIPFSRLRMAEMFIPIILLMLIEIRHEYLDSVKAPDDNDLSAVRISRGHYHSAFFIAFMITMIALLGQFDERSFIYFQF